MNNKEYTEAYLNWSAESVDKTLDAFDRHLQAQEDRRTILESATAIRFALEDWVSAGSSLEDWVSGVNSLEANLKLSQALESVITNLGVAYDVSC